MDRTRLIAMAMIISAALIAILMTYWYIFIYQPGRTTHDDYARPDTAIRLMVQPAKIQWYVTKLAPGITKYVQSIPKFTSTQSFAGRIDWIHAMPYEISMLYHHATASTLDMNTFINTHPNDPDFGQLLGQAGYFRIVDWVNWDSKGFTRKEESALLASGTVNIPSNTQQEIARYWNSSGMMSPPPLDENHFIELSVDNSGGVLLSLHHALMRSVSMVSGRDINAYLLERWPEVVKVHGWADLVEDDLVQFTVEVECRDAASAQQVSEGMGYLADEIAYEFERMGFAFGGSTQIRETKVTGVYEFYGFEEKLRRALGN